MGVAKLILHKCLVLRAEYSDAESCALSLGAVGDDARPVSSVAEAQKELASNPVILILSGYGVIAKPAVDDVVAKVHQGNDFVWSDSSGTDSEAVGVVTFMRRDQAAPLLDQLAEARAKVVEVVCLKASVDHRPVAEAIYGRVVTLRTMLRPSRAGSALCLLFAARIRLALLGVVLLALLVNTFVSGGVRQSYEQVHGTLEAARESRGRQDDVARQRQQKLVAFGRTPPYRYAWLSDRIAAALPAGIDLLSLSIQPLMKQVEEGKPVQVAESVVVVRGMAPGSQHIAQLTAALHTLGVATRIRLASVEQNRDNGMLDFKIELEL